jgi:hypothetical protein
VSTTERNAKGSSVETGLFAVLAGLLHCRGQGTPGPVLGGADGGRRARRCIVAVCALIALGLFAAVPALAVDPPEFPGPSIVEAHPTRAFIQSAEVEPNPGEDTYIKEDRIEYSSSESGPYIVAESRTYKKYAAGTTVTVTVKHLSPETTYYVRFFAETATGGSATQDFKFTTPPPSAPEVLELTGPSKASPTSVSFTAEIEPNAAETTYSFEYAEAEAGPYVPFSTGVTGKVAATEESVKTPLAIASGLTPDTKYYFRVAVENSDGHTSKTTAYTTATAYPFVGPPQVHRVTATSATLTGGFDSEGYESHWRFEYSTREGGPWTISGEGVTPAGVEGSIPVGPVEVSGLSPGTVYYVRLFVDNGHGSATNDTHLKTAGPPSVTTFLTHAIEGESVRVLGAVQVGFEAEAGYEAHYYVEYVDQHQFESSGWAGATSTPEMNAGAGGVLGEGLPRVTSGETYHYRFVASNTTVGDPVVVGNEETLTVPVPAPVEPQAACPNEAFRVGPAARLPDCRAYEQVTPVEKGGAQDIFHYGGAVDEGVLVGSDGEHVLLYDPGVHLGSNSDPIKGSYFFSRTPSGWQMTSAKAPGEPGVNSLLPEVFNPDLTEIGVEADWFDSSVADSPSVEFKIGPPGGPYQFVASVPRSKAAETKLVGESADGGKYVLGSEDRTLAGRATGTVSGRDLYEFSEGQLRQLNVLGGSPGTPVSTCGARLAGAGQDVQGEGLSIAVSAEGLRVFFTDNCTHHLYMRVNGVETVDLGEYSLVATDPKGTALLLENAAGELFGYDTETATKVSQSSAERATAEELSTLKIPVQNDPEAGNYFAHARYSYFNGGVPGYGQSGIMRYDGAEHVVECVSCASPYKPHPRLSAIFYTEKELPGYNGVPSETVGSANGDFVFFDTVAALLPQDVDGEEEPGEGRGRDCQNGCELGSSSYSRSSDVYEWRGNGVDGCSHVQGCLSLITTGKGGFLNMFLGSDASGRDVFFATNESLVAGDTDTASDIYDARIDGGFPPPAARPVECEGDSCSTPLAAPNDLTPSSATFQGAGDLVGGLPEAKKPKSKPKRKKGKRVKRKARRGRSREVARVKRIVHRARGGAK